MSVITTIRRIHNFKPLPGLANKSLILRFLFTLICHIVELFRRLFIIIGMIIISPIVIAIDLITLPFRLPYKKRYNQMMKKLYPDREQKRLHNHIKKCISNYANKVERAHGHLYLEDFPNHKLENKPLSYFILEFITTYRNSYNTKSIEHGYICGTHNRRSLGDIYLICKHYYPSCTIEEVLKYLITYMKSNLIFGTLCGQTNKFMYHNDSTHFGKLSSTEYGKGFNFKQLMEVYG
ncbi:MAG TPA: hypothetical protein VF680_17085 [Allosphingosinicella sp.]|jgi:hypothetical protein